MPSKVVKLTMQSRKRIGVQIKHNSLKSNYRKNRKKQTTRRKRNGREEIPF
jgi:hypothetical protein